MTTVNIEYDVGLYKSQWMEKQKSSWSSDTKLAEFARIPWTINKFISSGSISWLYGAPGSKKSFLAIDIACSVATGREWCGRSVKKGPVLYIAAEGGDDIHVRRVAWERDRGMTADELQIVSRSPMVTAGFNKDYGGTYTPPSENPTVRDLNTMTEVCGATPALIIFDTYSQTSPSDTKEDVSAYIKSIGRLLKKYPGMSALIIDHTTKEGGTWMGSQAKLGNVDMMGMVTAKEKDGSVTVSMRGGRGKIRGAAPFDDIRLQSRVAGLDVKDTEGDEISTLVLDYVEHSLNDKEERLLFIIGDGTTYGELREAWTQHPDHAGGKSATVRQWLRRTLESLVEKSLIEQEGKDEDSAVFPL